jgi:molecular chaperone Hsp33
MEERDIEWYCGCNEERMEQALMSIGAKDLKQLIDEDGQAEIICHFCLEEYLFEREKLESLLAEVERG